VYNNGVCDGVLAGVSKAVPPTPRGVHGAGATTQSPQNGLTAPEKIPGMFTCTFAHNTLQSMKESLSVACGVNEIGCAPPPKRAKGQGPKKGAAPKLCSAIWLDAAHHEPAAIARKEPTIVQAELTIYRSFRQS